MTKGIFWHIPHTYDIGSGIGFEHELQTAKYRELQIEPASSNLPKIAI